MYWEDKLKRELLEQKAAFEVCPPWYLADQKRPSTLTFFIEQKDGEKKVSAVFRHKFEPEESSYILRKATTLRRCFERLEIPCSVQTELGSTEGSLVIRLQPRTFEEGAANQIEDYCQEFVKTVALLQTAEFYGG